MSVWFGSTSCEFLWIPYVNFYGPLLNFWLPAPIRHDIFDSPDNAIAKTIDKMGIVWYNTGR